MTGHLDAEPGDPLTAREQEILRVLADGDTAGAVAQRLGITEQTIRNHLTSAYRKLGCSGLVAAYRALGWLRVAA